VNGGRRPLWLALAGSLAVFAAGAALAFALLPEWRAGRPAAGPDLYERELRRIAARAGLSLSPGRPAVTLATDAGDFRETYRKLGEGAAGWIESTRRGVRVRVRQGLRRPGVRSSQELRVDFALDGHPWAILWENPNSALFRPTDRAPFERLGDGFAGLLVAPGESSGPAASGRVTGSPATWKTRDVVGAAAPPQILVIGITPPQSVFADREAGRAGDPDSRPDEIVQKHLLTALIWLPLALAVVGIFLSLLLRSRIDLINGAALGLVALLSASPRWLSRFLYANPWLTAIGWTFAAPGRAVAILLICSAG